MSLIKKCCIHVCQGLIPPPPPGQNVHNFADNIFRWNFVNEKPCIFQIEISLEFVPKGPIDNKSALVHVMAWRQIIDKPYLNQCWPSSLTQICGTKGRWVKQQIVQEWKIQVSAFHITCKHFQISWMYVNLCYWFLVLFLLKDMTQFHQNI